MLIKGTIKEFYPKPSSSTSFYIISSQYRKIKKKCHGRGVYNPLPAYCHEGRVLGLKM